MASVQGQKSAGCIFCLDAPWLVYTLQHETYGPWGQKRFVQRGLLPVHTKSFEICNTASQSAKSTDYIVHQHHTPLTLLSHSSQWREAVCWQQPSSGQPLIGRRQPGRVGVFFNLEDGTGHRAGRFHTHMESIFGFYPHTPMCNRS